jgi:hypothetical protein
MRASAEDACHAAITDGNIVHQFKQTLEAALVLALGSLSRTAPKIGSLPSIKETSKVVGFAVSSASQRVKFRLDWK